MPQRSLYYWSKIYCEQLEVSEKYSKLQKTICINILDFNTLDTNKYHSIFKIKENEENYILTDLFEIHFLEMKKLNGYSKEDDLSQWINFIKADSKEVLEEMAKVNSNIDKALHVLETMCQDKKARAEYLSREMALHDEVTRLEEAMEEGREVGREEGKITGKVELLINLLTRKFKVIPEKYTEKLNRSPRETIEAIALDIFEINKIEDLDKYIYNNGEE